ncbi:hypothetical protein [Sphingopyxis sp.]|jgi:GMP synthase (glutamine-hydrolysing)|uniref:hypothetical protein n=1 Tax=Sphingopyxis sp. TaxID=1908224 RepID=UPI002DED9968|nr:hypothetical protein [Sphingopyxis sp.]
MLTHLSTVEDTFDISGRGLIVAPGIPLDGNWRIKIGDAITLERPDGSKVESIVRGMESFRPANATCIPLLLGSGLGKADVPIGTKLWVTERNS